MNRLFVGSDNPLQHSEENGPLNLSASSERVNRTHRVVRERARVLNERKSRIRSLSVPLLLCGGLVAILVCALWSILGEYELVPAGPLLDASQQMLVLTLWFLPLSGLLLGVVWFRRVSTQKNGGPR